MTILDRLNDAAASEPVTKITATAVPASLKEAVTRVAKRRGVSVSEIVRVALEHVVEEEGAAAG